MPYIFQSPSSSAVQNISARGTADVTSSTRISLRNKKANRLLVDCQNLQSPYSTAPISRIPVELLCDIFNLYTNDSQTAPARRPTFLQGSPESPEPWTSLLPLAKHRNQPPHAMVNHVHFQPTNAHAYLVNLWLERAADQPLDITLTHLDNLPPAWAILTSLILEEGTHCPSIRPTPPFCESPPTVSPMQYARVSPVL
ncbi:unnamed protein product [Cyclocybe aegerita]|uniref:Uncharacterized protein n=1 Tax=Cyclocybe aegerita TaxID=1973307 RepID=A0A8S0W2G1_CYCAE|nr:unnamed protein product [Cyclocybe aegerita]